MIIITTASLKAILYFLLLDIGFDLIILGARSCPRVLTILMTFELSIILYDAIFWLRLFAKESLRFLLLGFRIKVYVWNVKLFLS